MHPTLSRKHCQACGLGLVAPSSFLLIKIILNWLMDARSSKQSAAAQLTNKRPVVRTATWRNRMSFDKHCFEPYTHFVVRVTLIPGLARFMIHGPSRICWRCIHLLDQGSVAAAKGRCEQHLVLQLQVVPKKSVLKVSLVVHV